MTDGVLGVGVLAYNVILILDGLSVLAYYRKVGPSIIVDIPPH